MTIKQLLPLLNDDLAREYQAAIQYTQGFGLLTGAQYMPIRSAFEEHAQEELGHALKLSDLIQYYGGTPTPDVNPKPKEARKASDILALNADAELEAIKRYRERVKQAEDAGFVELGEALRSILAEELDHANELMLALGR